MTNHRQEAVDRPVRRYAAAASRATTTALGLALLPRVSWNTHVGRDD